tara:strand:- start:28 stop:576 length:549 start_codon:yes stop_codon:yes gene_type:complete
MDIFSNNLLRLLLGLLLVQSLTAESEIKLTARKDLVLSIESRASVLQVARMHLSDKDNGFLELTSNVEDPYVFEQPALEEDVVEEQVVVNYDDTSVLRVVAADFTKRVRGTLVRGSTSFLQLTGGNLIKPGASFPVSIPQAQGQTFTVTLTEVTSSTYTLKLGDATETISLNELGAGAVKRD